jgi:hypothetical protein
VRRHRLLLAAFYDSYVTTTASMTIIKAAKATNEDDHLPNVAVGAEKAAVEVVHPAAQAQPRSRPASGSWFFRALR